MEDLIRVLLNIVFDNPLIALIAFGIVSFVLNKARGAGAGKGDNRRGGMPPFGGGGPLAPPNGGGGMSRGEPAGRERPPAFEQETAHYEPSVQPAAAYEPAATPSPSEAALSRRRPAAAPAASKPAPTRSAGVHARNAAQGMIWSEIYGPPRAVRPHRATKR
ncbi:hypothetical protein FE782_20145 [Paenibacillus antri]|uniref:Uncharacterized protein n=1 Tax=Paenibacillus antri TaxID=2582848 RepID=A0A5R9G1X6_9BACL|nr:hypothetical protein [Paenibacillus antri]TLS50342.1 hypothetical protein FE782_20145 [Paenibacillus antri]